MFVVQGTEIPVIAQSASATMVLSVAMSIQNSRPCSHFLDRYNDFFQYWKILQGRVRDTIMSGSQNSVNVVFPVRDLDVDMGPRAKRAPEASDDSRRSSSSNTLSVYTEVTQNSETTIDESEDFFGGVPGDVQANGEWDSHTNTLPEDGPPPPLFEPSNPKLAHYFVRHAVDSLEFCSHQFASENFFTDMLDNPEWKEESFSQRRLRHLIDKPWTAFPNLIELDHWALLFRYVVRFHAIPVVSKSPILTKGVWMTNICEGISRLRNAAIHRHSLKQIDLANALKLPALFGDHERAADLQRKYRLVCEYPQLNEETKCELEKALYDRPAVAAYELLDKVRYIIEEMCFRHEKNTDPDWLASHGWTVPEQVESNRWEEHFDLANYANNQEFINDHNKSCAMKILGNAIAGIRQLRHAAAHRLDVDEKAFRAHIEAAKHLAIVLEQPDQADKIQELANKWVESYGFASQELDDVEWQENLGFDEQNPGYQEWLKNAGLTGQGPNNEDSQK